MKKISKRMKKINDIFDFKKKYNFEEAISFMKNQPKINFSETVEVAINLGLDSKKMEHNIFGSLILPYGTGCVNKIAVFTKGENIKIAQSSGADFVGLEDLLSKIKNNEINYHVSIATPDVMNTITSYAHILGPKGLMPSLKSGTVTNNISQLVKDIKMGQIRLKSDKNSIIHTIIGKIDFEYHALKENFNFVLSFLKKIKPSSSKGVYIKKITLSTTMGIGINIF